MFWADKVAKEIIDSGKFKPYYVDDMKTPSGYPAISALKGPIFHDLIYKSLRHLGQDVKTTFIINDFDVIDGLSAEFQEDFSKYLGFPLKKVPSPVAGSNSFGDYFADDYKRVLKALGVEAEYISSWDLYHEGKFDEVIKIALDNAEKIQDIYEKISGSKKRDIGWLPLQVICENCGKLGTTRVFNWDGEKVSYKCETKLVKWAVGCGHEGKISPFGGNGKLPWRVDWPAHWKVLGITIEGAGKDHTSAGGSLDTARALCREVFNYSEPFSPQYEFVLIGGKKMSTSKGLGLKARDAAGMLPPELLRFLFARSDYNQQVNFDPMGTMAIPDLFDEYDRCFKAYIDSKEEDLVRAFELSHIGQKPPKEKTFLPRFRDVVNYLQQGGDIKKKFESIKGENLSNFENKILEERIKYAKIWLSEFAPDEFKLGMSQSLPDEAKNLSEDQRKYLTEVIKLMEDSKDPEKLQTDLYNLAKELGLDIKESFGAIYLTTIGKTHGPRAGSFLLQYPKEKIIERLKEAIKGLS